MQIFTEEERDLTISEALTKYELTSNSYETDTLNTGRIVKLP